ncbi:MAG: DUF4332 domain-containing protein [Actinomycetia bacterium]|nr:DUF4332 domain-containing protein [Actinomycetes bacterium]
MAKLSDVEGIAATYARRLAAGDVRATDGLHEAGTTRTGQRKLAARAEVSERRILEWVSHVDLMRVKGVGPEYSDLLEAAGVDSVPELCRRNPAKLAGAIAEANTRKRLIRHVPSERMIAGWIAAAKQLRRIVTH